METNIDNKDFVLRLILKYETEGELGNGPFIASIMKAKQERLFSLFTYLFNVKGFLKIVSNNTIKIFCWITRIFWTLNCYLQNYEKFATVYLHFINGCLLYTSPSPRDQRGSRMPSSA